MNSNEKKLSSLAQAAAAEKFHQLTQINLDFQSQQKEHGFKRAQTDVNETLAEKRILLNNRFVLESVIGSGGMGCVYKAKDLRKVEAHDSNPYVAVKVLNTDFKEHPNAFISLQREASRSHLLSHPHIVTVHDFDRDGNTIYMTMELLKGEALDDFLHRHKGKSIDKEKAFKILGQFFNALHFAHQKGIIHSDLKPANIFISDQGVKVLDFGIARLASESKLADQFDAATLGALTPAYASLEMLHKKTPHQSDDVYAAAIIAYQLLTGKHPYEGQPAAAAHGLQITPEKVESLSNRQWKALLKALAIRREDRTQSIKEFHQGLTQSLQLPVFKIASVVLLALVGWFSYSQFFVPDELTTFVEETIKKTEQCYKQKNYFCAINSANAVLEIAPEHIRANQLLKESETKLQLQEQAERHQILVKSANSCFAESDFGCVQENIAKVLAENSDHEDALRLAQLTREAIEKRRAEQLKIEGEFASYLTKAKDCIAKKHYDCAVESANLALAIKPADTDATTIIRNANYAIQQEQESLQKANKILKDGETCFAKLNYSCAIAKSESALEFVPGHKKALKLKRDAEKAIADAKKNITIE